MTSIFVYGSVRPTSAAVESEFNDLKNRILKDEKRPMRVDYFISRHLDTLAGKLKLAVANEKPYDLENEYNMKSDEILMLPENIADEQMYTSNENIVNDDDVEFSIKSEKNEKNSKKGNKLDENEFLNELSELKCEVNWSNKNQTKQSHRYGDPLPQFDPTLPSKLMLPTIINGNFCKNVDNDKKTFIVKNTCGFDSACQILATSIRNNAVYEQAIGETHNLVFECARTLINNGLKVKFYRQRAQLLSQLKVFEIDLSQAIIKLNAAVNISNLLNEIFTATPSCITTFKCKKCNAEDETISPIVNVNHNILKEQGFSNLVEAIENGFFKPNKPCCNQLKNVIRHYGPTVMVDTDTGDSNFVKLHDIPLQLELLEGSSMKKFVLAGVIAYNGTFKTGSIGHYTAYMQIYEKWLKFDGNYKAGKVTNVTNFAKVHAHMCIYTIS